VDRVSVERFARARSGYLAELARALCDGSYRPQPVRRVYIPKGKGQRPLGIPAVKDRVEKWSRKFAQRDKWNSGQHADPKPERR